MTDVAIIGGGLSGLINAILLARRGWNVVLFEKKDYPFHRVCGEYISNEVVPFLRRNELFPQAFEPSQISNFIITSTNGKATQLSLDLGGFGISRYSLDNFLYQTAIESGVDCKVNTTVSKIIFSDEHFKVNYGSNVLDARIVIGAHGKRSVVDKYLGRSFMERRSPYAGIKYHIKTDFPADTIALHNFKNGYCGISKVEGDTYNLCYLTHRSNLRQFGNVPDMERAVLMTNPFLRDIFENSDFLFDKPLVINEINFERKQLVEDRVLMSGDAAGMIAPLCGNGMAMAIHSAKVLSEVIDESLSQSKINRDELESKYKKKWNVLFARRLYAGRQIQKLFGSTTLSNVAVYLTRIRPLANTLVQLTHGKEF